MSYIVVVFGLAAIAIMWWSYYQDVVKKKDAHKDDLFKARLSRIFGSVIAIFIIWSWGIEPISDQQRQSSAEDLWLTSFAEKHKENFFQDCEEILATMNPRDGVMINRDTGQTVSLLTCRAAWAPPSVPSEYSNSESDQPDRVGPFPSQAIFGPDLADILCLNPYDESSCYSWDYFAGP